jgi:hypothetical protein
MAKRLNKDTAAPAQTSTDLKHNSAVRGERMRKDFERLWQQDREISLAVAEYVTPIREVRSDIWKQLRTDLEMKGEDLAPHYALYKRGRMAAEIDDMVERQRSLDALREIYETLATGTTLNFLSVVDGASGTTAGESKTAKMAKAAGRQAGDAGRPLATNPHADGTDEYAAWEAGWEEGQAELRKDFAPGQTHAAGAA